MRHTSALRTLFIVAILGAGCRRVTLPVTPKSPVLREEHCWWTVTRTPMAPDSVAARFASAFTALGLRGAAWHRQADTAWAHATPTVLSVERRGALYDARAVAVTRGDSTSYRVFVAVGQSDSTRAAVAEGGLLIPFCGALLRAAGVGGSRPSQPTDEDALSVWRRRS